MVSAVQFGHSHGPWLCPISNRVQKAHTVVELLHPSAKTTSVEQASGAANVEHTIHSSCSLSRALLQTHTCPAVAGHLSVAATAAAINVTSS